MAHRMAGGLLTDTNIGNVKLDLSLERLEDNFSSRG
jgi:hypothetical protein